jgi:hypothetical protein
MQNLGRIAPRDRGCLSAIVFGCLKIESRVSDISDFGWPYDLKPLEYGFDLVMHVKPLRGGLPPEEPAVGRQPPFTSALALTFIPGEPFIDRVQRSSPNLGRAPDRARTVGAVEQDDVAPDDRRRLSVGAELANQSRGSALDSGDRQFGEFGRHLRAIAEGDHVVIVVVKAGGLAISAPEFIRKQRSHSTGHDIYPFGASASAARIRAHERMPL